MMIKIFYNNGPKRKSEQIKPEKVLESSTAIQKCGNLEMNALHFLERQQVLLSRS
jgi:hypothetical protein